MNKKRSGWSPGGNGGIFLLQYGVFGIYINLYLNRYKKEDLDFGNGGRWRITRLKDKMRRGTNCHNLSIKREWQGNKRRGMESNGFQCISRVYVALECSLVDNIDHICKHRNIHHSCKSRKQCLCAGGWTAANKIEWTLLLKSGEGFRTILGKNARRQGHGRFVW